MKNLFRLLEIGSG